MKPWFRTIGEVHGIEKDPLQGRTQEQTLEALTAIRDAADGIDLDWADGLVLIWHTTSRGEQALLMPVLRHRHDQDCGRA